MATNLIVIVGGASFDPTIKDFFESYDLYIEHYNARKSSDLKKQTVPKNTLGVIITIDRSHMVFGNSNELTRHLQNNEIPFVFSSGNLASFNAAKILLQKIQKKSPDIIKEKIYISEKEQKLDLIKQEWKNNHNKVFEKLHDFFEVGGIWDKYYFHWTKVLDEWKLNILEWKEIQNNEKYKSIKKRIIKEFSHLITWKEEIHNYGLQTERNINILKQWKHTIEKSSDEIIAEHDKLKLCIDKINNLDNKNTRVEFKEWRINFEKWKENVELWEKEFNDWYSVFPDVFKKIEEWEKAIELWNSNRKRLLG